MADLHDGRRRGSQTCNGSLLRDHVVAARVTLAQVLGTLIIMTAKSVYLLGKG